jgi:Xaa-Pro aminopeptidase
MTAGRTTTRFSQRLSAATLDSIQAGVRDAISRAGLDAVLTESPEDVAYLTGFFHHPGERPVALWLDADRCMLLVPELERENAERQGARAELVSYPEYPGTTPPFAVLADALRRHDWAGTGVVGHATSITWARLHAVGQAMPDARLVPTEAVAVARRRKRPEEVTLHAEAARITDIMLAAGVELVRAAVALGGMLPSEAELAAHVTAVGTRTMYAEHDDVVVVSPLAGALVYAGANSAYPHGLPSGYRLRAGEMFMLSLGCAVGGRFVEGERTFVLGTPNAEQRRYHDTVRLAQEVGGAAIRPGAECRTANDACLAVIRAAGLGGYLRHRQGHGIGLGMHEPPWLESGDATVLEPGMVVSNEPGLYVPGHAGYRISDSMLVTDSGSRPLTSYPRSIDDCVVEL